MIRAKFHCQGVKKYHVGKNSDGSPKFGEEVELSAVYGDENKPWSEYTPSGRLTMSITNPAAIGKFEPGKDYFLDLSAVVADGP